jgi:hypothetical protein
MQQTVQITPNVLSLTHANANNPEAHKFHVEYTKERWNTIAERYNRGYWQQPTILVAVGKDSELATSGGYDGSLAKPGDMYEALLLRYELDASKFRSQLADRPAEQLWEIPDDYDFAVALADRSDLIADWSTPFGGTWLAVSAQTREPVTTVIKIAKAPPVQASANAPHRSNKNDLVQSYIKSGATSAGTERSGLSPGHDYWVLITAFTHEGYWDERVVQVTLRKRQVKITPAYLYIVDDGDPDKEGEINVRFRFYEEYEQGVQGGQLVDGGFRGDANSGDLIGLKGEHVSLGPSVIREAGEAQSLTVVAEGTEYDGFLEPDEQAYGDETVPYPSGRHEEFFKMGELVDAPAKRGSFHFQFGYSLQVTYPG